MNEPTARPPRTRSIEFKVLAGFVTTLLLLLIGAVYVYHSAKNYAQATEWVARTQQIRAELANLYGRVSDAESAHLTYLLDRHPRRKEDYEQHTNSIPKELKQLFTLMIDPEQLERLIELERLIAARLHLLDRLGAGDTSLAGMPDPITQIVDAGTDAMLSIRNLIERMDDAEAVLLARREALASRQQLEVLISLSVMLAGMSALFALLFISIRREALVRARREAEIRDLNTALQHSLDERTSAHDALQESEARYRRFIDLSPFAVFVISLHDGGRFVFLNPKAVAMFGARTEAELLGRSALEFLHPDCHAAAHERMRGLNEEGVAAPPREEKWMRVDGSVFDGEAVAAPIEYNGHPAALAMLQEIGERKHLIAELTQARGDAEQANRAKSAFLAAMSHEIRTPMNGVVGMVEVLARSNLTADQSDGVKTIRESAFSLLALIDDILDFSKIEAGRLEFERAPVSISDMVEGICVSLTSVAARKGFSGDRASQQGAVAIRVEVSSNTPLEIAFRVSDNGIGMNEETLAKLFTTFTQGEASTTRRFGGTGLGLVITKRLVELMHGKIAVESRPAMGSTFTVTLPTEAAPSSQPEGTPLDIRDVDCVVVSSPHLDPEDVSTYLMYAGARVHVADDLQAAARHAISLKTPIMIHDGRYTGTEHLSAIQDEILTAVPDARHVVIMRGSHTRARVAGPNVVTMDGSPLRRQVLLRAVAVAAGRASPDVFHEDVSHGTQDEQVAPPTLDEARRQGRLLLIAEDDAINQKVILKQLALLGYAGELAGDGAEALRLWHTGQYALLLTDLHMPEMDGYALTEAIRREEAQNQKPRMPILALTANALRGEMTRAIAVGMDEYITKPVQLHLLATALEKWLPASRAASPAAAPPQGTQSSANTLIVDVSVLKQLVGDDAETVCEFLDEFRTSAQGHAAALRVAVKEGATSQVAALTHKLKSSSRAVGALPLGNLCAEMEAAAKAGNIDSLQHSMQEFETSLTAVIASIGTLLTTEQSRSSS